jgi:hypothetical protein
VRKHGQSRHAAVSDHKRSCNCVVSKLYTSMVALTSNRLNVEH